MVKRPLNDADKLPSWPVGHLFEAVDSYTHEIIIFMAHSYQKNSDGTEYVWGWMISKGKEMLCGMTWAGPHLPSWAHTACALKDLRPRPDLDRIATEQ
jgi:hypothetical protein